MQQTFRVGVVTSAHGVHGEVKVYPTTDDPKRFKKLKECFISSEKGSTLLLHPEQVKFFKNMVIIKFREWNTPEDSLHYRGKDLLIDRKDAVPLAKGEYYIADLIDLKVVDEDGRELGVLTDVLTTGANDVYEVSRDGDKPILIPAIPQCILQVDLEAGIIKVHLLDGLLDL
ncbi:MAG: ribosome maturation factor RimM [Lachnospiraceae bacterium]|nr:ribosome maturation factor RimM [Lachnospiraceae bacterium]